MRRACARLTMPTHSSPAGHPSRWREAPLAAGKYDGKRMNIGSIKRLRIAGLHPTRRFSTGFGLLAALLLVFGMIGPSLAWGAASTTSVPGGYVRCLGALEGKEGTRSGGSILYDLTCK